MPGVPGVEVEVEVEVADKRVTVTHDVRVRARFNTVCGTLEVLSRETRKPTPICFPGNE